MDQDQQLDKRIQAELQKARKILVVSHIRPDGDAIGSLLGMGLALVDAGKDVQMVLSDGIPGNYKFLPGSELIATIPTGEFDYIIVVDSADLERTDTALRGYAKPNLNIDHHQTNTLFAHINLIDVEAVATAEIITRKLSEWGLKISVPIANALLAGVVTDTIGFRTSNMKPKVLRIAADLMEMGGNLVDIYYRTISEQSFSAARYWGAGLSKLRMENELVWTTLSLIDRQEAGYQYRDDADLVKILTTIEGAKVAVILTEQSDGYVKISWRLCGSLPSELNVSDIALKFGGGGHKAAAGADVKGSLAEVLDEVLAYTRICMNHNG